LVGSTAGDTIGQYGVAVLVNDNYVVLSPDWDNGAASNVGAATFGSGSSGISGVVTSANSLVGSTAGDLVGRRGVTPLSTGNYVVQCPECDNGAAVDAGAVIFGSGSSGISGIVAPANSLVGSSTGDRVGDELYAQPNGAYVVKSEQWDDGATIDAGAVTLGPADGSATGAITDDNSAIGLVQDGGPTHRFSYDPVRNQLAVGQRPSTRVVLHRTGIATAVSIVGGSPDPSVGGEPVTFTATVSASPNAPNNGQVTFAASSGESCVDATPTPTSATSAEFSCSVVFNANGVSTVTAEYTGSLSHAYGRSAAQTHTTIIDAAFASGFESP
jgi:hypothetical protein